MAAEAKTGSQTAESNARAWLRLLFHSLTCEPNGQCATHQCNDAKLLWAAVLQGGSSAGGVVASTKALLLHFTGCTQVRERGGPSLLFCPSRLIPQGGDGEPQSKRSFFSLRTSLNRPAAVGNCNTARRETIALSAGPSTASWALLTRPRHPTPTPAPASAPAGWQPLRAPASRALAV